VADGDETKDEDAKDDCEGDEEVMWISHLFLRTLFSINLLVLNYSLLLKYVVDFKCIVFNKL
jgi:hypothetical protein